MSIINTTTGPPIEGVSSGVTFCEGSLSVPVLLAGVSVGRTVCSDELSGGEPINVSEGRTVGVGALSVSQSFAGVSIGSTTGEGSLFIGRDQSAALNLIVNIVPPISTQYQRTCQPRLKIEGVEIDVIRASLSQRNGILVAEIADVNLRETIELGAEIEFGIGKKVAGVWHEPSFEKLMPLGYVASLSETTAGTGENPQDTFVLRASSQTVEQLAESPETQLIIYDSAIQTLSADQFEPEVDTEGRTYPAELKPLPNLTLYKLLQEVFITRAGFANYVTNLPDLKMIDRVDIEMGQSYLDGVSAYLGNFEPVIFPSSGGIWFLDSTILFPAGFPAPLVITADDFDQMSSEATRTRLDAFRVRYMENSRDFDFIDTREEVDVIANGTFGDPGYTTTLITNGFREYKRFTTPSVVLRDELYERAEVTSGNDGVTDDTLESYVFDSLARMSLREKRIKQRVPDVNNAGDMDVLDTHFESEQFSYAIHPFQPRAQYVAKRELQVEGLILVDSARQQLGRDFEMPYSDAAERGNLEEGQTTRYGKIRTYIETTKPLRNGEVRTEIYEYDHLNGGRRIPHKPEERPGDVSISGIAPNQRTVLVFDDENTTRSRKKIESISAGSMTIDQAVPWARRRLKQRKTKPRTFSSNLIAYRPGVTIGSTATFKRRNGSVLGNFIIVELGIQCDSNGVFMMVSGKQF